MNKSRMNLVMFYIRLFFALCTVGVFADLHQLHHPTIFMRQDVTVLHVQASEIDKARSHLEVTAGWYCESIPPDKGRLEHQRLRHRRRIEDLNDLERVNMNVE